MKLTEKQKRLIAGNTFDKLHPGDPFENVKFFQMLRSLVVADSLAIHEELKKDDVEKSVCLDEVYETTYDCLIGRGGASLTYKLSIIY